MRVNLGGFVGSGRRMHVVPGVPAEEAAKIRLSNMPLKATACGREASTRWYEVGPGHDICRSCRKKMGWSGS